MEAHLLHRTRTAPKTPTDWMRTAIAVRIAGRVQAGQVPLRPPGFVADPELGKMFFIWKYLEIFGMVKIHFSALLSDFWILAVHS